MPYSRIEAIKQAIRDYEDKFHQFLNPNYQPTREEAEEHKDYLDLKSELDRAYIWGAFKPSLEKASQARAVTDRILAQTGLGPVPEVMKSDERAKLAEEIAEAQSEPHGNEPPKALETSASALHSASEQTSEPAVQATPTEDQEPSNSSEKQKRVRHRRKKRLVTDREKDILEVLKKGEVHSTVYCHALELKKIPPRQEWIDQGCPTTYPEAYRIPKWRKRIQDEKYRLSQFLPKKRTHHSSQTSATRRKRVNL